MRAALSVLAFVLLCAGAVWARPPNIVLVIGDDLGWPYTGFMGDPVARTPNLDELAAGGTVFTQGQVPASLCRPTLQTLLSGLHPSQWTGKHSVLEERIGPLPTRQEVVHYRTLPRELQAVSYASWEGGKMWEGRYDDAGFTHGLANRAGQGLGIYGGNFGRTGWDTERCGPGSDAAVPCPALDPVRDFLDDIGDAPFFLWFAPKLPHTPFTPPPQYVLDSWQPGMPLPIAIVYGQIVWLDAVVGELLAELAARGIRDETLIVFLSDNGWEMGQGFLKNLLHGKGTLHELGTRTPIVFHWPGRVPAGVVREDLVSAEDLFPTLLDYAGAEALPDRPGRSLRHAIETGAPVGRERVLSHHLGIEASDTGFFVRTAQWRYIASADGREQLYEVSVDPYETRDVSARYPEQVEAFRALTLDWSARIQTPPERLEVAGRLQDAAGRSLVGASVRLEGEQERLQVLTGRDGRFLFRNLPHGDYVIRTGQGAARGATATRVHGIRVSLPVGPTGAYLTAIVSESATTVPSSADASIVGVVRGRDLEPVADARVTVTGVGGRRFVRVAVRSDAEGRYLAEHLPAGRYRVRAQVSGGFPPLRARVALGEGERRVVPLASGVLSSRARLPRRRTVLR